MTCVVCNQERCECIIVPPTFSLINVWRDMALLLETLTPVERERVLRSLLILYVR